VAFLAHTTKPMTRRIARLKKKRSRVGGEQAENICHCSNHPKQRNIQLQNLLRSHSGRGRSIKAPLK